MTYTDEDFKLDMRIVCEYPIDGEAQNEAAGRIIADRNRWYEKYHAQATEVISLRDARDGLRAERDALRAEVERLKGEVKQIDCPRCGTIAVGITSARQASRLAAAEKKLRELGVDTDAL